MADNKKAQPFTWDEIQYPSFAKARDNANPQMLGEMFSATLREILKPAIRDKANELNQELQNTAESARLSRDRGNVLDKANSILTWAENLPADTLGLAPLRIVTGYLLEGIPYADSPVSTMFELEFSARYTDVLFTPSPILLKNCADLWVMGIENATTEEKKLSLQLIGISSCAPNSSLIGSAWRRLRTLAPTLGLNHNNFG